MMKSNSQVVLDNMDNFLKNKTLLVTGGTGSFGNTVVKKFLGTELKKIRIFSRDEKKQEEMRLLYNSDKLGFILFRFGYERRGLCFSCGSFKASAFLRVLPHGGY